MKLVYRVKFRAWGITFREIQGEVDLAKKILNVDVLTAIAGYIKEKGHSSQTLVGERGVYIGIVLDPE